MRFLVDENLPIDVVEVLQGRGDDVIHVAMSPLVGKPDEVLNEFAVTEDRIIVTKDLDFPLRGVPSPGLVLVRVPPNYGRRQIRSLVEGLIESPEGKRLEASITVVSPGRIRSRPVQGA